mmetsp:Transcript_87964/g.138875  ORF Transcript_87964/g.138875 Transcript_87964/m.138875 type:complete len:628 (+) Transcript_87964:56-1939(+)
MELSILEANGLPDGSILSVRSGPTRRQSPLPCTAPFRLPAGPWPLRIDILALLGKSSPGANLGKLDAEGCCKVPLEARDGRQMSVTLQVYDGKASGSRPKTAPVPPQVLGNTLEEADPSRTSPIRRRDTEAEARSYLDRHRLHEFMHALFELLLRERPEDPYSFIAQKFREAANQEENSIPENMPSLEPYEKPPHPSAGLGSTSSSDVLRSNVSTAPSIRKEPSSPLPEGAIQVTIRSLRGRSLSRLTVQPSDKVFDVKARIQACLGVPISSQSLLWWSETLANETTLEDHDVPGGGSVHLVCSTRDPRFRYTLSGSSDGGLKLWSLDNGELVRDFSSSSSTKIQKVQAVAVDWTGMRAVSGSHSGCLHLWDLTVGQDVATLEGHTEEVNAIDADWASMRALSGSSDSSAILWNLEARSCVHSLAAGAAVYSLAVDWAKNRGFGGLSSGSVRLWDLSSGVCIRDIAAGAAAALAAGTVVASTNVDPSGNRAVSGLEDGHLAYWHFSAEDSFADEAVVHTSVPTTKMLLAHYSAVRTIVTKWAETYSRALCGSDDGSLSLWRLDSQECLARFARHIGMVWAIHVDWDRDRAVSGAFDGCVKLWDLRNGDCLRTTQAHSRPVRSISAGC